MFYLALMLAGGLGVLLRYLISRAALYFELIALPFGTLTVNVVGSFLIGYLSISLSQRWSFSNEAQIVLLTGFLGGFTTFSAFSLETITMMSEGASIKAINYAALQLILCFGMCFFGVTLARHT